MAGLLSFSQSWDEDGIKPSTTDERTNNHDNNIQDGFSSLNHQFVAPVKSVSPTESDMDSPESPSDDRNRASPDCDLSNSKNDDFFNDGGRLLTTEKANFELPSPLPMPSVLNMQYICETASRLLFVSIHWLKGISALNLR